VCSVRHVDHLPQSSATGHNKADQFPQLFLRRAAETVYSGIEGTLMVSVCGQLALIAELVAVCLIEFYITQVGCVEEHGQTDLIGFCVQVRQHG